MKKLKELLFAKSVQILGCTGIGVLLIAKGFSPGGSRSGGRRGAAASWGSSVDPVLTALGAIALVAAIMLYRKWSLEQNIRVKK
jgi:hypothetical protein